GHFESCCRSPNLGMKSAHFAPVSAHVERCASDSKAHETKEERADDESGNSHAMRSRFSRLWSSRANRFSISSAHVPSGKIRCCPGFSITETRRSLGSTRQASRPSLQSFTDAKVSPHVL